ncbi:hypothetical protein L6452_27534 [Arctium lappa]|uniref:Uncharacterized protein n=1 Tax=Arctium lappa TaxID=4217 RepID=A0ACB8ZVX4_ARCLA|nr:hypothetical protein L6452_27534 [Arctium lappa]
MIEKSRSIASPEQTASGKDLSSPLARRPTFSTVLTREKDSKVKLGMIPKKTQHATQKLLEDMEDYDLEATYTGFKNLYKKGRETTELSFVEEHYYTSDKRNISYFNYFPNAHPETKSKYVQIGVCKDKIYAPSQAKDALLEKEDLQEVAEQKLLTLISKVFDISKEDKLKFERENLMSPGDKVFSITYLVAYALTNSHHSVDYKKSEYIEIEDVFSEIGGIEEKQFSSLSPLDNSWAIDIAKNKLILDQKPRMSFRNNHLEIGESSNIRYEPLSIRELSQRDMLHSVSIRVDDLCEKLELLG